jgi:hypothetical protein
LATVAVTAQAGTIISSAVKIAGNETGIVLLDGGLANGVNTFVDRSHVLLDVPAEIAGADYVQVSNSDKQSDPYQIDVTISRLSALYIGLDNRDAQPKSWMNDPGMTGLPTVFFDTGVDIGNDENGNGSANNTFSLWATIAPPGTYSTFTNLSGGNNFIIFADNKIIPEPTSLALVGMGLLGLVGVSRRRNRR